MTLRRSTHAFYRACGVHNVESIHYTIYSSHAQKKTIIYTNESWVTIWYLLPTTSFVMLPHHHSLTPTSSNHHPPPQLLSHNTFTQRASPLWKHLPLPRCVSRSKFLVTFSSFRSRFQKNKGVWEKVIETQRGAWDLYGFPDFAWIRCFWWSRRKKDF